MLAALQSPFNQQVLDEWTGIIAAGAIRSSLLGCLRALIKCAQAVSFTPERALRVSQARKTRQRMEAAQAQVKLTMPGPIDEGNPIVQRLMTIAQRKCRR